MDLTNLNDYDPENNNEKQILLRLVMGKKFNQKFSLLLRLKYDRG